MKITYFAMYVRIRMRIFTLINEFLTINQQKYAYARSMLLFAQGLEKYTYVHMKYGKIAEISDSNKFLHFLSLPRIMLNFRISEF